MGGAVNVFVRDHDRNFYKMTRWTNTLPDFLDYIGHVDDEVSHLKDYMDAWLNMRDDWKKNGPTGPFEYNMTSCYFPPPTRICNREYGLVFVDFITKTVISRQGYTSIGIVGIPTVHFRYDADGVMKLYKIANKGKLYVGDWRSIKDSKSLERVVDAEHCRNLLKDKNLDLSFKIDNSPWVIDDDDWYTTPVKELKTRIDGILEQ